MLGELHAWLAAEGMGENVSTPRSALTRELIGSTSHSVTVPLFEGWAELVLGDQLTITAAGLPIDGCPLEILAVKAHVQAW